VELLVGMGKYSWSNLYITTKSFPLPKEITGPKKVRAKLFHYDKPMYDQDIIKDMESYGYRPANAHELLSFGLIQLEEQEKRCVVGLSAVAADWRLNRKTMCLRSGVDGYGVDLAVFGLGWGGGHWFLAIKEV